MRILRCVPLLLFVVATASHAQQTGINGTVTDPSGAIVVGAKVEVKEAGGATFVATTNSAGAYVIPTLVAADYSVTVSALGFGTVEKKITILVGQKVEVNLTLVGGQYLNFSRS